MGPFYVFYLCVCIPLQRHTSFGTLFITTFGTSKLNYRLLYLSLLFYADMHYLLD